MNARSAARVGRALSCLVATLAVFAPVAQANTLQVVAQFSGGDGASPLAGLVKTKSGQLFGTAAEGGKVANCVTGCGTIYRLTPAMKITPVVKLSGAGRSPGHFPAGGLLEAADGWLYGTTAYSVEQSGCPDGCGTVYRTDAKGNVTTVARLTREVGANSYSELVQLADGTFYGTAMRGGTSTNCIGGEYGCGTVFSVAADGKVKALVQFDGANGAYPSGPLVVKNGNLFGTTSYGGTDNAGTVFRVTPEGKFKTLVSFDDAEHGRGPSGGLVVGADGNFYGTTVLGGEFDHGTVFRLTPGGVLTTLVSFRGQPDGGRPAGPLTLGWDGNFYGATTEGGDMDRGTLFRVTPQGSLTTLITMDDMSPFPKGRLLQDEPGVFYGVADTFGVIYRLTVEFAGD